MAITEEKLTEKEVRILQSLADGERPSEKLPLAHQTVRKYLVRIREKLDARTTCNAVASAVRRGIVD
jgi:DNA-binding NarL/FixJ family response regulator